MQPDLNLGWSGGSSSGQKILNFATLPTSCA